MQRTITASHSVTVQLSQLPALDSIIALIWQSQTRQKTILICLCRTHKLYSMVRRGTLDSLIKSLSDRLLIKLFNVPWRIVLYNLCVLHKHIRMVFCRVWLCQINAILESRAGSWNNCTVTLCEAVIVRCIVKTKPNCSYILNLMIMSYKTLQLKWCRRSINCMNHKTCMFANFFGTWAKIKSSTVILRIFPPTHSTPAYKKH